MGSYKFHLGDKLTQGFRVADSDDVHLWIRQGISFTSVLHHLAEHPGDAAFRLVDAGPERITLIYHLAQPASTARGMGLTKPGTASPGAWPVRGGWCSARRR